MRNICCIQCQRNCYVPEDFQRSNIKCKCGKRITVGDVIPYWVILIRKYKELEDKGVGDTVQRIAAKFGGESFKTFSTFIGIPCGCTQRQEEWNKLYPY